MKKIISFTIFGKREMFLRGALRNAELAHKHYPEWVCRFYVSREIPESFRSHLTDSGAEVVPMRKVARYAGKYWRLFPAGNVK